MNDTLSPIFWKENIGTVPLRLDWSFSVQMNCISIIETLNLVMNLEINKCSSNDRLPKEGRFRSA